MDSSGAYEDSSGIDFEKMPWNKSENSFEEPTAEHTRKSAVKYNLLLGEKSPGRKTIEEDIKWGSEELHKEALRDKVFDRRNKYRRDVVERLTKGKYDPVVADYVNNISNENFDEFIEGKASLKDILHKEYGNEWATRWSTLNHQNLEALTNAMKEDAEITYSILDKGSKIKAYTSKYDEMIQKAEKAKGNFSVVGDYIESFVPLKTYNDVNNALTAALPEFKDEPWFTGNKLEALQKYLARQPVEEGARIIEKFGQTLIDENPVIAADILSTLKRNSAEDRFYLNVWDTIDVIDIAGMLKGGQILKKALQAGGRTAKNVAEYIVESSRYANPKSAVEEFNIRMEKGARVDEIDNPAASLEAAGDTSGAAAERATREAALVNTTSASRKAMDASKELDLLEIPGSFETVVSVPTFYNPELWWSGANRLATRYSEAALRRIRKMTEDYMHVGKGLLKDPILVERLTLGQIRQGMADVLERAKVEFPEASHAVLDAHPILNAAEFNPNGTLNSNIVAIRFGRSSGELFPSHFAANAFAQRVLRKHANSGWAVRHNGSGEYFVELYKPIDETALTIRGVELEDFEKTPESFINTLAGWFRGANQKISSSQTQSRNVVVHSRAYLQGQLKKAFKEIGTIRKGALNELRSVYEEMRMDRTFDNTLIGFTERFRRKHNKFPSEKQIKHYYTYKHLNELDYVLRDFGWYRDKVRHGIEKFSLDYRFINDQGQGQFFRTPEFEGVRLTDFPEIMDDARVMINQNKENVSIIPLRLISETDMAEFRKKFKTGELSIVQVANQNLNPLKDVTSQNRLVSYVITDNYKTNPIGLHNAPNVPGGHVVNRFDNYVKSGSFHVSDDGVVTYQGDVALFNVPTSAEARKVEELMETARKKYNEQAPDFEKFIKEKLGEFYTPESFRHLYEPKILANGQVKEPPLNPKAPFVFVKSGARTTDATNFDYRNIFPDQTFVDSVDNPHNIFRDVDKKFGGERGEAEDTLRPVRVTDQGVLRDVDFGNNLHIIDNTLVDPIKTLQDAVSNSLRGRLLADYKIKSVEDFIREFGDTLEASAEELRANPVLHFHEARFKQNYPDKNKIGAATNMRRTVLELLGTKTELAKHIDYVGDKMQSYAFEKAGIKGYNFVSDWAISTVSDPTKFMRSFAFHTKLGLFNPVQVFLQAQSAINAVAISPKNGLKATALAFPMRGMIVSGNPKVIRGMAEKVAKVTGMSTDEVLEIYETGNRSGYFTIEGEVAVKNDIDDPKLFKGAAGTFIDKGAMFFNEGERMVRLTSWATAMMDWRRIDGNKFRKIDNRAVGEILEIAKRYSLNMTAEAGASWQKGIAAVPTQFFSYQARLFEQFFDGKIPLDAKMRLVTVYSAMYGLPVTLGASLVPIWPMQEDIKQRLIEHGIDYSDFALKSIVDGLVPTMINSIAGTDFQFAERYGPGGLSIFKEIWDGDKGVADLIFGASGSITAQAAETTMNSLAELYPSLKAIAGVANVDNDPQPDVLWGSLVKTLREVSSVNQGMALYMALNTGIWYSKNGTRLANVTPEEATFMALTGMKKEEMSRANLLMNVMKKTGEYEKTLRKRSRDLIKMGLSSNDFKVTQQYFDRARAYWIGAGLDPLKIYEEIGKASRETDTFPEQVEKKWSDYQLELERREANKP